MFGVFLDGAGASEYEGARVMVWRAGDAHMITPKIHGIRIQKFRRIRDSFKADWTTPRGNPVEQIVFAGPNGCGKTSILEAVLLGLGLDDLIVRDVERKKREEHWRVVVPPEGRVELDVSNDEDGVTTWIRTEKAHVRRFQDGREEPILPQTVESLMVEYFSSWRTPALIGAIRTLAGPGRRPQDTESNRLWRLKQRINDERAKRSFYIPNARSAPPKDQQWLERINEAWARFHDDTTRIDAQLVDPEAEDAWADLFILSSDGQRICSIDQCSSGELELLCFASSLVLNDFRGGILMIDEPELHLHPQWQATILPALRVLAPDTQFLVASHADAIWDQTSRFARFLLVPETDPRSRTWREAHALPESPRS